MVGQALGEFGEFVGSASGGQVGQVRFGLGQGARVDVGGQVAEEGADHRDVLSAGLSLALGGGQARQHRLQRFAGHGPAGP